MQVKEHGVYICKGFSSETNSNTVVRFENVRLRK